MSRRCWSAVLLTLACIPTSPVRAQFLNEPGSLRHAFETQAQWAEGLASSHREAALRFLTVVEEILALPNSAGPERTELLGEAQRLSDLMASLEEQLLEANTMVRETQARALEAEVEGLWVGEGGVEVAGPLDSAAGTLSALARVVADEFERLKALRSLQEELRLFLGDLRLFDGMNLPPSARSGGEGGQDPGCSPVACAITGSSPADVPLMNVQPETPGGGGVGVALTLVSLARLFERVIGHAGVVELPVRHLSQQEMAVTRDLVMGAAGVAFRDDGSESSVLGPRGSYSFVFSMPLGRSTGLTVEPSVGGQALRGGSSVFTELAGEVRERLTGVVFGGRSSWQVTSWQKGRFLSESLPPPGYLEPGRAEAGLSGRMIRPLDSGWEISAEGGADGVRYEPEDWKLLNRQGITGALGAAWRGTSKAVSFAMRGSHHGFPDSPTEWEERRVDTRLGAEVNGSLEGKLLARLSLGGSWNQSRLPAYDFRLARAALTVSLPWGKGSFQGYAALAHQLYLNPGPEDARVAPSDQDSGSVLSLQYARPLDGTRMLLVRGGWSRSQTGFRNDFYERFGMSVHLSFRGR